MFYAGVSVPDDFLSAHTSTDTQTFGAETLPPSHCLSDTQTHVRMSRKKSGLNKREWGAAKKSLRVNTHGGKENISAVFQKKVKATECKETSALTLYPKPLYTEQISGEVERGPGCTFEQYQVVPPDGAGSQSSIHSEGLYTPARKICANVSWIKTFFRLIYF